ncbi:MAG TPA: homocitrate synthase, partial [Negativicutes bacterium]
VPAMGEEEQEALKLILAAPLTAKVIAWNRAVKEDIMASIHCGFSFVHISVPVSDLHIQKKLCKSREWVIANLRESILLAQSYGCTVSVGAEDASRADLEFILQVADVAAKLGAIRIRYADTVGCLDPFTTHAMMSELLPRCPLPLEVHMHNDFGLATANTLAAVEAGVHLASTTIAGIGERAGNAAMEEVVSALHSLYDVTTGINVEAFKTLSELVMQASKRNIFPYKSIIGSEFLLPKDTETA